MGGKGDGNYEKYLYDSVGRLIQANYAGTNPGHGDMQVDFTYDSSSRVTSLTQHEAGSSTVLQSSAFAYSGGQTVVTDGNGHASTFVIDAQGRVTKATDALGHAKSTTWTSNSDVATTTDALGAGSTPGNVTTYSYDALNNATQVSYPTGAAASAVYALGVSCPGAGSGNSYLPKCSKDDAGNGKRFSYDTVGNLTKVVDTTSGGTGATTQQYTYDNAAHSVCGGFPGQVCTATDGNGNVTSYSYNSHGDLLTVTPPAPLGVTTYTPDGLGRTQYLKDGNGKTTSYGYNGRDQLVSQNPDSMGTWNQNFFGNGLLSAQQWNGVARYIHYDAAGRIIDRMGPNSQAEQYTYDKVGNLLTATDTTGTTSYGYDNANHLTSIKEPGGTCPTGATAPGANSGCVTIAYDNNGNEITRTFPGAATVTTTRDLSARATRITAKDGAGTVRSDIGYSYTVVGGSGPTADRINIQTRTSYLEQGITPGAVTGYAYDSLRRLLSATEKSAGATTASWAYSYDNAGNRTQQIRTGATGASAGTVGYTYNAGNELTATTVDTSTWSYDGNGAQTRNGISGQTQTIDNRGTVSNIDATSYTTYSPGNNEQLTRSTPSTTYQTSNLGLATETVSGSTTAYTRTGNGDVFGSRTGTSRNYFAKDSLGSVIGIFDATGAWQGGYSYSPYGEARQTSTATTVAVNPIRYIGGYLDSASGLYKLGARYYDQSSGRFTQTDPSGQERNPYAYVGCNPINAKDPSGLFLGVQSTCQIFGGIAVGAGTVLAYAGAVTAGLLPTVAGWVPSAAFAAGTALVGALAGLIAFVAC